MTYRILVVDDSNAFRKAIIKDLSALEATIYEAENGVEGLKIAEKEPIDLVLSDIDMPKMDGIQLCMELKLNEKTAHIPIIIQSIFDSESDIERGFQAGASAYLSKSDTREKVVKTVDSILSKVELNRSHTVLVVDDSEVICRLIQTALTEQSFNVIIARDGREAIDLMKQKVPHLILCDIDMPVMNGFEFCKRINADGRFSGIPFVVMSASNDRSRMQRMMSLGAEAYLYKPFNPDELVVLIEKLLSDHYLILLNKKEKLESEQSLTLASISSLVAALEARDAYTRGHSEYVARCASEMGKLLGMKPEMIERLRIGGKLHDIGKIGVKDRILLKPGKLTQKEYDHIKEHPVIGATILEPIQSLRDIVEIVLYHHERFDGSGYPKGLKGPNIPPWARMVSVADMYTALVSDRPYRKAMPREKALGIIEGVKGTQLCPESVELLIHCVNTGKID